MIVDIKNNPVHRGLDDFPYRKETDSSTFLDRCYGRGESIILGAKKAQELSVLLTSLNLPRSGDTNLDS